MSPLSNPSPPAAKRATSSGTAARLRQLLTLDRLPSHEVVAGAGGLDTVVSTLLTGTDVAQIERLPARALLILPRDRLRLDEPTADLALHLAASARLAGLLVQRPLGTIPLATIRLADKLGLPLVVFDELDGLQLTELLDPLIRVPELANARVVMELLDAVARIEDDPERLTAVFTETTGIPLALIDAEGRVLSGDRRLHLKYTGEQLAELVGKGPGGRRAAPTLAAEGEMVLHPALVAWTGPSSLWFAADPPVDSFLSTTTVRRALDVIALAFSVSFSRRSLETERDIRDRGLLLEEIFEQASDPTRTMVERAAALGWRLTGWHLGVHLTVSGPGEVREIIDELETELEAAGIAASLVHRSDGWETWFSYDFEPRPTEASALSSRLRRALIAIGNKHRDWKLSAGIGQSAYGTAGIKASLAEARQACFLAQTSAEPTAVEHADAFNASRLLAGWYGSELVRETADQLLAPLREIDPTGELVRTLRCYLDNESSMTTTAIVLGLHRNTIAQRMAKIQSRLPLDLDRPDQRLIAHLAARGFEGADAAHPRTKTSSSR